MQREQGPRLVDGKLPVFVFPNSLTFFSDDQSTHKQVLTLYNPYEFSLKFKVLSTSPKKYSVVDSEGSIKSSVIRHKDVCLNNEGVRDKLRINVSEQGTNSVIGRKDVTSVLLPTRERSPPPEENFESIPSVSQPGSRKSEVQQQIGQSRPVGNGPSWVVISAAVFCILALMLPSQGDKDSRLPSYLYLNHQQKLIAAYILGLVTMAILRS